MAVFCYKKLDTASRTGTRLHDARVELGLTLEYISEKTHIQKKYLEALEANRFSKLPKAKAYRLAYIKEFAAWVGLAESDIVEQFIQENGIEDAPVVHPLKRLRINPFASITMLARNLLFISFILAFTGYLFWQVRGVLEPPRLTIFSPIEGYTVKQTSVMVAGETESETQLTINGQDIMVNNRGKFETKIDLSQGVNTLVFTATKKHGKSTSITRHLVVENNGKISLK